jgi:hypothetical protein
MHMPLLRRLLSVTALAFAFGFASVVNAQETRLTVVSWNVESGGSQPQTIAQRIRAFQGVDIWGLSEMPDDAAATIFEAAAEDGESANFERIVGTTGGADKLAIIYDAGRFEKVRHFELPDINPGGRVRAPLVAHLRNRANGQEFLFMVNHLYRSNATARHQQVQLLNEWAAGQTLPVLAVGDYNFDWSVENGDQDHDRGYDNMIRDGVFTWVRPPTLIRSRVQKPLIASWISSSLPGRR